MKQAEALRVAFQALSEIAIIGHLADTALAQTLPKELSVAGESPTKLARAFQVTKGAMTYTLQQLEEVKYVTIESDPKDARGKIVRLTKAGARAREKAIASVEPGMRAMVAEIGAEEFSRALPFLIRVRQVLDAARD